jgi:peptide/nickel transport system substrate-binding protein
MSQDPQHLERWRASADELGNAALDAFLAGRVSRRELLRYLAVLGTAPLVGLTPAARAQTRAGPDGATIRVASLTPGGAIDPVTITDPASLALIAQTGEFLVMDNGETLTLEPALALSWQPNASGDVWTFKLRPGVHFNDGAPLTAHDVVATFDRLCDPASGSAALSVLKGVLSRGGARAVDETAVAFHLDAPNGNFPYYVSSDNYNAIILPAGYKGGYEQHWPGTGPFVIEKYQPRIGASFTPNPRYWGRKPLPARLEFHFYADAQSSALALAGRQADVMADFTVQSGLALLNNPDFRIASVRSSSHRQIHMRCDQGPFRDKRVRRAVALTLDRDVIAKGLFRGHAQPGNDSPFAPVFPSSDPSVPRRRQDLAQAHALLQAAGFGNGFPVTLTTEKYMELPELAVLLQNALQPLRIAVTLKVETQDAYYGSATFGKSDWLDSPFGITDYGHRGVPNVFLNAPLASQGTWNAAHFRHPGYDALLTRYSAALDLASQKAAAGDIERLLLDETPVVIPYFYDALTAVRANLRGVRFTAISQLFLDQASFA